MTTQIQDPEKQLELMRAGVAMRFPIKIRALEFQARPLSVTEQNEAFRRAQEKINSLPDMAKTSFAEAAIIAQEFLVPASREFGQKEGDSTVTGYLLNRASPEELQYMYKQYCAIVDKFNPGLETLPPEEIKILVDSIKKKKKEEMVSALIECSFKDLVSICHQLLIDSMQSPTDN